MRRGYEMGRRRQGVAERQNLEEEAVLGREDRLGEKGAWCERDGKV